MSFSFGPQIHSHNLILEFSTVIFLYTKYIETEALKRPLQYNRMICPYYHCKFESKYMSAHCLFGLIHPVVVSRYCISINDQISMFNMVIGKLPKLPKRWTRAHALCSAVGSAAAGTRAIRVPISNANFCFSKTELPRYDRSYSWQDFDRSRTSRVGNIALCNLPSGYYLPGRLSINYPKGKFVISYRAQQIWK